MSVFVAKVKVVSLDDNGLNNPVKRRRYFNLYSALNADIVYIQELHLGPEN